ncbi:hypothetical protein PVL29_019551 [Vitis rotundifolia]|uniref:Diacylglycerol kinase accessory domain-containing protein n=1 Tax=Vitis rotundifolia TaxID=103349 RepID=A0AA39DFH3_VITRO|nr:hypothetical protein PVL29_019551 [Vitis rotundifolia]
MSADILQFLKNKFMDDLQEAEEEDSPVEEIPLHSYFQNIKAVLEGTSIHRFTPIRMKDCLYDLISTLEDCILFSEKRKRQIKEGGGSRGRYSLPELWFLCKRRRNLLQIKKKLLLHTSDAAESSSASVPQDDGRAKYWFDDVPQQLFWYGSRFNEQKVKINNWLADATSCNDGSVKKMGIIGVGGSGKTKLMRVILEDTEKEGFPYHRIWIDLSKTLRGDIDFEEILKDMLKQCDGNIDCKDYGAEKLLALLYKVLSGKSYLIVLDGVWDINLDWFFRLGSKLEWDQNSEEKLNRCVIITTRLPCMARKMIGSRNLHHMLPLDSFITQKLITFLSYADTENSPIWLRIGEEIIEQCHGLPLAVPTLKRILLELTVGRRLKDLPFWRMRRDIPIRIMMDCKEDDMLAKDLFLSYRSVFRNDEIFGGDAVVNRLLQAICDTEDDIQRPIAHIALGGEANISVSLGWANQTMDTISRPLDLFYEVFDAKDILIDSWSIVMGMSLPHDIELPDNCLVQDFSEEDLLHMGGDKELHARFWNYYIIGLDAQEWFEGSSFKSWPRNAVLPISIKIKDHQHQWKNLKLHHGIRSIVCLNMPSFPGGLDPWGEPNVKKKRERKFTASFVDDQLLEVIGFRDAWHVDKFLPLNAHGIRLAQAQRIRFELCRGAAKQIYMSFDGIKWKQPTPIDDDTFPIETSYLGRTRMVVNETSKCKLKASGATSNHYPNQPS